MPKLEHAELRQWYEKFSKELYEKGNIDVTRKEDLGRVKNFDIKKWDKDDVIVADSDFSYAYMRRNENGYVDPAPDYKDFGAYAKWMMRNLNAEVTDDQIQTLYDQSRAGTLMIFQPGTSIHNMRQVYTDEQGNLHTSLPMDQYDVLDDKDIPEDIRIPVPPRYEWEPDPRDYFKNFPKEPERPNIKKEPGFFSWLGYKLNMDTDYAKVVRYEKAMEEYSKQVAAFMKDLPNQEGDLAKYEQDKAAHERSVREFPGEVDAFYNSHLGKLSAIDRGFRDLMSNRPDAAAFRQMLEDETKFLTQQHDMTPLGKVAKALRGVNDLLRYPDRTKKVIRHLLGDSPDPNMLGEWIKGKVIKKGAYKPEPYEIPKSQEYSQMNDEQKREYEKKWSSIAELAGFAAIVDPKVCVKEPNDGLTLEESVQLRYGMILNDLITMGRPAGQQHMDVLEPARETAKKALEAYHANDPKPLATLLARSLQYTNREARLLHHMNQDHTLDTLYLVERLYNTLTGDEKLLKAAELDPEELEEARGNIALYKVARQGQLAKKAILEHSLHNHELSQEELLNAAKDVLFANTIAMELDDSHNRTSALMDETPEQKLNKAMIEEGHKYRQLQKNLNEAKANNNTNMEKIIQTDIDNMQAMIQIGKDRYNVQDLRRPAHTINQSLRDDGWVAMVKDKLAADMNLDKVVAGSPEEIGAFFAQDSKVMCKLDDALRKAAPKPEAKKELEVVQEVPEMEENQPEKQSLGAAQI